MGCRDDLHQNGPEIMGQSRGYRPSIFHSRTARPKIALPHHSACPRRIAICGPVSTMEEVLLRLACLAANFSSRVRQPELGLQDLQSLECGLRQHVRCLCRPFRGNKAQCLDDKRMYQKSQYDFKQISRRRFARRS